MLPIFAVTLPTFKKNSDSVSLCKISKKTSKQIPINTCFGWKHGSTGTKTDKHEFIGPFQLRPGVQELG